MTEGQVSKLVIVIHGFLKSLSSSVWMLQLSSLLTADPDTAVLLVGWGHGSGGSPFPGGTKTYFILQLLSKLSLLQIHFIIINIIWYNIRI